MEDEENETAEEQDEIRNGLLSTEEEYEEDLREKEAENDCWSCDRNCGAECAWHPDFEPVQSK